MLGSPKLYPYFEFDIKEAQSWTSRFPIWKNLFHSNHIGIHLQMKERTKVYFIQDKKCTPFSHIIYKNESKKTSRYKKTEDFPSNKFHYREEYVRDIAQSIFSFLSYLHKQAIVFGNMNFNHIVIGNDKKSAITTSLEMSRSKTRTNLVFCAPEVLGGNYNTSSDVWNAGILLYIMLFGCYPFSLDSEESLKNDILNKNINFPSASLNCVSKSAKEFILKLLEKDFKERMIASNCLDSHWIRSDIPNEIKEKYQTASENWFSQLPSLINKLNNQLETLKFNKLIKSRFSVVHDILFEKEKAKVSQNALFKKLKEKKRKLQEKEQKIVVLVAGVQGSGKKKFVVSLAENFFKTSYVTETIIVNGFKKTIFEMEYQQNIYWFIVADLPKYCDYDFPCKKEIEENFCSDFVFPDTELKKSHQIKRGIHSKLQLSSQMNTLKKKPIYNFNSFCMKKLSWNYIFTEINSILFFSDCTSYESDNEIDLNSLHSFENLLQSNFVSNPKSIHGNIPITVVVNKIDSKPNLNKVSIKKQFLKKLPDFSYQLRSQVIFSSNKTKDSYKAIFESIEIMENNFSKLDFHHPPQNLEGEEHETIILRNNNILKNSDFGFFKIISFKNLRRLELIRIRKIFEPKMLNTIIYQLRDSNIEYFLLSGGVFPPSETKNLEEFLESKQCTLKYLKMINLKLTNDAFLKILESVSKNMSIISLDFSGNPIEKNSLEKLVKIAINNSISEIYLSTCSMSEESLELFIYLFKYSNELKTLDISKNPFSLFFLKTVVEEALRNTNLPLCNFSYSISTSSPVLLQQTNTLIYRNRRNFLRGFVFNELLGNKRVPLFVEKVMPASLLTSLIVEKIFSKFENNKNYTKALQQSLEKINLNESISRKSDFEEIIEPTNEHDNPLSYLYNRDFVIKPNFEKIDLSWFELSNKHIKPDFLELKVFGKPFSCDSLKIINLSHNQLTEIPTSILSLKFIEELYLGNNEISSVSQEISNLSTLTTLDLRNNLIMKIPDSLSKLVKLKNLYLHFNALHHIKYGIFGNLKNLERLTLHSNFLDHIPFDLFEQCKCLQEFTIFGNPFNSLKKDIYEIWGNKKSKVDFSSLSIEHLPFEIYLLKDITELDLSNNKLKYLPPHVSCLTNLKKLDLRNNNLLELPFQISKLFGSLDSLYLHGNSNLKLPKELTISSEKPLQINQYSILSEFLENQSKQKPQRKNVTLCVLFDEKEDFEFFVNDFFQNSSNFKTSLFDSELSVSDIKKKRRITFETSYFNLSNFNFSDSSFQSDSEEIIPSQEKVKRITIQKFEQIAANEQLDKDINFYKEIDVPEFEINLKIIGFGDNVLFHYYSSIIGEENENIYVVITDICEDVSNLGPKLQTIRNTQKGPIIILGTKFNKYSQKKRRDSEISVNKKYSIIYNNIQGMSFMMPQNLKFFLGTVSKLSSNFVKLSPQELQLENLIDSEETFCGPFPINYSQFTEMKNACNLEEKNLKLVLEKFHKIGSIIYFNTTNWGENKLVFLQPYFVVFILSKVLRIAKLSNGIFDIYECYSELIGNSTHLLFSPLWVYSFTKFLQKIEAVLDVTNNKSLSKQYSKVLKTNKNKFYIVPSQLPESKYDWETIIDLWDTFSDFSENEKVEISTFQTENNSKSSLNFLNESLSEKSAHYLSDNHIEKWYFLAIFSYPLINRVLFQITKTLGLKIFRIWKNCVIFKIDTVTCVIGIYPDEIGHYLKVKVKGEDEHKYFFILDDIIEDILKIFNNKTKISIFYPVVPTYGCSTVSIFKTKFLENVLLEKKKSIDCASCLNNFDYHKFKISQISPFLTLYHLKEHKLLPSSFSEKTKLALGSRAIIYRSTFNQSTPVALKEMEINGIKEEATILYEIFRLNFFLFFLFFDLILFFIFYFHF